MPQAPLSRRDFLTSGAALAAAANVQARAAQPAVAEPTAQRPRRTSNEPVRILAMASFEPHEIAKIRSAAPQVDLTMVKTRDEFRRRLPDAEVVYGALTASELESARNVKWVQSPAAGVESLDPAFMA